MAERTDPRTDVKTQMVTIVDDRSLTEDVAVTMKSEYLPTQNVTLFNSKGPPPLHISPDCELLMCITLPWDATS